MQQLADRDVAGADAAPVHPRAGCAPVADLEQEQAVGGVGEAGDEIKVLPQVPQVETDAHVLAVDLLDDVERLPVGPDGGLGVEQDGVAAAEAGQSVSFLLSFPLSVRKPVTVRWNFSGSSKNSAWPLCSKKTVRASGSASPTQAGPCQGNTWS